MSAPRVQGSIRRRLQLSLLASAALMALVVYFLVLSVARQVAQESQDNVLAASARSILDSARFVGGQLNVDLPYSALSMLEGDADERVFYAIRLEDELLSGYPDLPVAEVTETGTPGFLSAGFLGEDVRIANIARAVSTDEGQGVLQVAVAQTLNSQKQTLAQISRTALGIGAGVFLLSALIATIIARSTIRPLDQLAGSVSRRGPKDLRPVQAPVPREMGPLVASLNTLMGRLNSSLTRSEDFIAEAAHRVRTPLAVVRTKAEIIERKSADPDTRAAVGDMIHAIDDSSRTASQLLDHAMVTFRLDNLAAERIDLQRLAQDTVDRLRPISELKDIDLTCGALDAAEVHGDLILLQNALHNIVDNAIKYGPRGSQIEITCRLHDAGADLQVKDTGPGFAQGDTNRMTERFTRGGNAAGVVGSGLGLTIAKEVVEAHGGHLKLSNSPEGGACVTLHFPQS